ncbi:hypothetical protein FD06_GL000512 [Apilactobacillus ozensis DSM 23829 = JCM 17196]|uniref:Uncharacterized protein n=1 Tax=Apilactobacillus ozensis DSM 23829 = JCM 17196 TaxID=1423781 RepID=A0A0R2ALQ0_9LACO|nr:hypothetical protein [Apilactobacillus ozensis]KRM67792.1 hypothetical protein FD06_GL000512 [Apilactobacillus ozensis DSM 23829 = JCM 17196]
MPKNDRKNQDKLEKKFKSHWYTKWWIYVVLICIFVLSSYVYKKVEKQRNNNRIAQEQKIKAPNTVNNNVFSGVSQKQRHNELTNHINNKILLNKKIYGDYKISFNKSEYLIINLPKNSDLINQLNHGTTDTWDKMAHKLLKATKWISGNYGKQYANIAITYNNEQNKIFFLAQNGHIKFNVSDKIKENLKNK